jgi:hypothetical protein
MYASFGHHLVAKLVLNHHEDNQVLVSRERVSGFRQ